MTTRLPLVLNGGQIEQLQAGDTLSGVARVESFSVGDGSSTAITLTHNLGTLDVSVTCYRNSTPWDTVIVDVTRPSVNTVTLTFETAPASSAFRAVITG